MNEASKHPERPFETLRGVAAVIMWLTQMLSMPAEMLLHEGVGERYLGISGGLAALLMIFFAVATGRSEPALLWLLVVIFVTCCMVHRILCVRLRLLGGPRQHTRYPGRPNL